MRVRRREAGLVFPLIAVGLAVVGLAAAGVALWKSMTKASGTVEQTVPDDNHNYDWQMERAPTPNYDWQMHRPGQAPPGPEPNYDWQMDRSGGSPPPRKDPAPTWMYQLDQG
jgi:hypothetical protein